MLLHKEINFLVFFGKFDMHSAKRMSTFWRKQHVKWTLENLAAIYGGSTDSGTSETREVTKEDGEEIKAKMSKRGRD